MITIKKPGAPTVDTIGQVGQHYINLANGDEYECVKIDDKRVYEKNDVKANSFFSQKVLAGADCEYIWNLVKAGGAVSWEQITDKPFYEDEPVETVLFDQTVEVPEMYWYHNDEIYTPPITPGKLYMVTIDDVMYRVTASNLVGDTGYIGNRCFMNNGDYDGVGLPFAISGESGFSVKTHPHGEHHVKIATFCPDVQYIPSKYIENMYYENKPVLTTVLEKQSIDGFARNDMYEKELYFCEMSSPMYCFKGENATYIVHLDGVEYKTTYTGDDYFGYIGNSGLLEWFDEGVDNGLPFVIVFEGGIFAFGTTFEGSTHIISITEVETQLVKIPEKFVPVIEEGFRAVGEINNIDYHCMFNAPFIRKNTKKCRVTLDGVIYTIEMEDLGYCSIGRTDNLYVRTNDGLFQCSIRDDELHDVKVEVWQPLIKDDYLPDSIVKNGNKEMILTSSTEESKKRFKITVDDSGTIKATEIIE